MGKEKDTLDGVYFQKAGLGTPRTQGGHPMLVKFTVEMDGREVGIVEQELSGTAAGIEEQVRQIHQQTGRMVLDISFQQIAKAIPAPTCCGHKMENRGFRPLALHTTFGEIPIERRRYCCQKCGYTLYPADSQLCCGHHHITRPLAQRVCQLATVEHFTRLPELLTAQHGVTLSHETLLALVHDVGSAADELRRAEAQWSAQKRIAPCCLNSAPARIYVSVDGIMYCTNLTEPHPDHPGENRLIWQQMKVGCVYWQDQNLHWHKQMVWGRESPEEFAAAVWRLACQCGYQEAKEKIFAADGGSWCWDIQARYFSDATGVLDWYHASEHVWGAARVVAPDSHDSWANNALEQMRAGGGQALLQWLKPQVGQRRGGPREALEKLVNYLSGQIHRTAYHQYRASGWQIGTGMMESTCKQLVGQRLKGPGMHWTEQGALAVTALRANDLNGNWNFFWNSLTLPA